jgi:glycosyltransferase involved in cell wall biosynthesis
MVSKNLKISIVTVCYNAEKTIENTIKSVISQTYKFIECIIIDGNSTDGTLNIIKRYKDNVDFFISEKDNGIYDAMNKGIKKASGDIIYFLNSDDRLYDHKVIEDIVKQFKGEKGLDIVYGKVQGENFPPNVKRSYDRSCVFEFKSKRDLLKTVICHQRVFSKKELFQKIGLFNTRYKIYADYDWFLRNFNKGVKIKFFDRFVAYYNCQGLSFQEVKSVSLEKIGIIFKNCSLIDFLFYLIYATLRSIKRALS